MRYAGAIARAALSYSARRPPSPHSATWIVSSSSNRSLPDAYADAYFGLLEDLERLFRRAVDLGMVSAITISISWKGSRTTGLCFMRRKVHALLYDIQQAGRLVHGFTQGKTFDDCAQDPLLRSGVERQLEIVAEALNSSAR